MSLNYQFTVPGAAQIIKEQPSLYNTLIWISLGVDLGEITEKNVDEWVFRANKLELTNTPLTEEMVKMFVGLHTNVGSLTRKQWATKHNPLMR